MCEWTSTKLDDLCTTLRAGGTPPSGIGEYYDGEIPFVTIEDITNAGKKLSATKRHISKKGLSVSAAWLVDPGHILLSMYASVGKATINQKTVATNQAILALMPDEKAIDREFLFQTLASMRPKLTRLTAQTTQANLNADTVKRLEIRHPTSLELQQKIAKILSTLDEAIERTEALIEKTKKIKAGLMQDLFTRGVLPNGQLRPPQTEAPHLYKDSPLGWIPGEWNLQPCSELCLTIIDCKNRTPPETKEGHPVIRTPNVRDGDFVWTGLAHTNPVSYEVWTARGKPESGDIVITREAPVGEVCRIPENLYSPCLGQRMMLYRPDLQQVDGEYFLQVLQSTTVQKHLDLISGGSTVGHVKVGDIRELKLPVPNMTEQLKIASPLRGIYSELRKLGHQALKLQNLRSGLMHDLLQGNVQISLDVKTLLKDTSV